MGCHFLLQGIFHTQGSILHCKRILYHWATREAHIGPAVYLKIILSFLCAELSKGEYYLRLNALSHYQSLTSWSDTVCSLVCYCALVKVNCSVVLQRAVSPGSPICLLTRTPTVLAPGQEMWATPSHWPITVRVVMQVCPWEMACRLQPGVPSQPSWPYPVPDFTCPVLSLPLSFSSIDLLCGLRPFLPSASPLYLHRHFSLQISCISSLRGPKLAQVINQSSLRKWGVRWGCEIGLKSGRAEKYPETQTFWVMFRAWVIPGTGWGPSANLQKFRWLGKTPSEGDPLVEAMIQHLKIRAWNRVVCRGSGVNWLLSSCSSALLRRPWEPFCEKPGPLTSS